MGGLGCAKQILDRDEALRQKTGCMRNSILLNAAETQPTEEHLDRFLKASEELANLATEIEKYVNSGGI